MTNTVSRNTRSIYLLWKPLTLILLSILSSQVFAASAAVPSVAQLLGNTSAGDKSIEIFTALLGGFFTAPLSAAGGSSSLIGSLFLVFNAAVFVIGMMWAGYGLLMGISETSNTGQVLGQKISATWMPIRMVTGVAGIVPVFGGFSLAQVLIVTMTTIGIGLANTMWKSAIDSANNFNMLTPPGMSSAAAGSSVNFQKMAHDLFRMHICVLGQQDGENELLMAGIPQAVGSATSFGAAGTSNSVEITTNGSGLSNICGAAKVSASWNSKYLSERSDSGAAAALGFRVSSVNYSAYANKVVSLQMTNFAGLDGAIGTIAGNWYASWKNSVNNTSAPRVKYPHDDIESAGGKYAQLVASGVQTVAEGAKAAEEGGLTNSARSEMLKMGWMSAGSWFATFAEANAAMTDALRAGHYESTSFDPGNLNDRGKAAVAGVDRSNSASGQTGAIVEAGSADTSGAQASVITGYVLEKVGCFNGGGALGATGPTGNTSLGQALVTCAISGAAIGSGGTGLVNPIIMMKNMGDYLIIGGEAIYAIKPMIEAVGWVGKKISAIASAVDVGATPIPGAKPVTGTTAALLSAASSMLEMLMVIAPYMIAVGALMAAYIPMIPFLTWMGGLVQYCVVVCQGLVGAPIAALSHMDSQGEGLGGRTEPGYMFILNVTFRPALMLFGFFLASGLLVVIGTFQVYLFVPAMANSQGNSITGIVLFLAYVGIFLIINITLIQSLFNMIFLLPDQVLGLIGSHGAMTDIGRETEGKIHGTFINMSRAGQSAGSGLQGARAQRAASANAAAANAGAGGATGGVPPRGGNGSGGPQIRKPRV